MWLDVDTINPEDKDYTRALELGGETPDAGKASRMAKAIKDQAKLIRRSKAVVGIWGTEDYINNKGEIVNAWKPFEEALTNMGFSPTQILKISDFVIEEDNL